MSPVLRWVERPDTPKSTYLHESCLEPWNLHGELTSDNDVISHQITTYCLMGFEPMTFVICT